MVILYVSLSARGQIADPQAHQKDRQEAGRRLAEGAEADLAAGRYQEAIQRGSDCTEIFGRIAAPADEIACLTTVGRAKLYLGQYAEAVAVFERAASKARQRALPENEAAALTNIGSAKYYIGDYTDAYTAFSKAMGVVEGQKGQDWYPRLTCGQGEYGDDRATARAI